MREGGGGGGGKGGVVAEANDQSKFPEGGAL
jgi:hypothetical protein